VIEGALVGGLAGLLTYIGLAIVGCGRHRDRRTFLGSLVLVRSA
jgi:hypothetical protein